MAPVTARVSLSSTGAGVRAGAARPNHASKVASDSPCSASVRTSGKAGERPAPSTASARSLPAFTCGARVPATSMPMSTSPTLKATSSCPLLRYGTACSRMPAAMASISPARCGPEPGP